MSHGTAVIFCPMIISYGACCFTTCQSNPLIVQALKILDIKPRERNLPRDVKEFILMNIDWMKRERV